MDTFETFHFVAIGTQLRQGDILLVAEAALPDTVEPVPRLAGYAYHLSSSAASVAETHAVESVPGVMAFRGKDGSGAIGWLRVIDAPVTLTHPEHAAVTLAPGVWRVIRQREYDPATARRRYRCD